MMRVGLTLLTLTLLWITTYCSQEFVAYDDVKTYSEAKAACESVPGRLATWSSRDEFNEIVAANNKINSPLAYVGLDDIYVEGTWTFIDGDNDYCGGSNCRSLDEWNSGEPYNNYGDEDCAVIDNGGLNDMSCTGRYAYICEHWSDSLVSDSGTILPVGFISYAKLTANDAADSDQFGNSVSVSADGKTMAIGAFGNDDAGSYSGSVYVFEYTTSWSQVAKLTANDAASGDIFGVSVSVSGDGKTIVIGAYHNDDAGISSGSAYVFKYTTSWSQVAKLTANDAAAGDWFGYSVSISGDGKIIVIGARSDDDAGTDSGSVYVFKYTTSWSQVAKLTANDATSNDNFGFSVSISDDGKTIVIGAHANDDVGTDSGSVYVFKYTTSWSQMDKLTANDAATGDNFGFSVSISGDGKTIVIGARYDDDAIAGTNSGSAYVFKYTTSWSQVDKLTANDAATGDIFGASVSVSGDGKTIAIGAHGNDDAGSNSGSVYVFKYTTSWSQVDKLTAYDAAGEDYFGKSVSVSGDGKTIVIGAVFDDDAGSASGSVYVFVPASMADLALESRGIKSYGVNFAHQHNERKDIVQQGESNVNVQQQLNRIQQQLNGQLNGMQQQLYILMVGGILMVILIISVCACNGFRVKYYGWNAVPKSEIGFQEQEL